MTKKYRSQAWFSGINKDGFIHRSYMRGMGLPNESFDGRPIIGICNTFSEFTPCNAHFRDLAQHIKTGILEAGGVPVEFPVFSCGESNLRPTAMLFRNLASMDVEESIRGNPMDAVVLMAGCDKTTPSLLMGAASTNLPTILISGGPMLNGHHQGQIIGNGTNTWKLSEDVRAGVITPEEFMLAESDMNRSAGHCNTMGTASSMACMAEALGIALPMNAAWPAADTRRNLLARMTGRRIVALAENNISISQILTKSAFENAIKILGAVGGSTNAVVHLLAIAGRLGVDLSLDDWDRCGRGIPTIVNLMPAGKYLMEDFCYAGGLPVVMKEISHLLNVNIVTVSGKSVAENIAKAKNHNQDVILPIDKSLTNEGGIVVLYGNLAPDGAVLKPSAATPELLVHRGPAVVFENIDDFKARIDDPNLDVDENSILVMKNCGPKGYPGMAEVGNMALPKKLLEKGIRDMIRISDARMSGTAFGTVVLHCAPEAAVGGNLALVKNGDMISLDVPNRKLILEVEELELTERRTKWVAPEPDMNSGYQSLYTSHVLQANQGVDLDFLVGCRGAEVPRESH